MTQIQWLQELEKRPRTMNDHYFSDYKDKFMALYRGERQASSHGQLVSKLKQHGGTRSPSPHSRLTKSPTPSVEDSTTKVLSGLTELGVTVKSTELLKLLPADPLEPALHIMATVRAYFQGQHPSVISDISSERNGIDVALETVAYKRFIDSVPMAIDYELLLGINRDHRLEQVLYRGLGITGGDASRRCKEFLAEPPHIVARRKDLEKRRARLESAKRELMDLWM